MEGFCIYNNNYQTSSFPLYYSLSPVRIDMVPGEEVKKIQINLDTSTFFLVHISNQSQTVMPASVWGYEEGAPDKLVNISTEKIPPKTTRAYRIYIHTPGTYYFQIRCIDLNCTGFAILYPL